MEASNEQNSFKYIPFKCYIDDRYVQKLIKPINDEGQRKCLGDLIEEIFPGKTNGNGSAVKRSRFTCLFRFQLK